MPESDPARRLCAHWVESGTVTCLQFSHWRHRHANEFLALEANCWVSPFSSADGEQGEALGNPLGFNERSIILILGECAVPSIHDPARKLLARGLFTACDLHDSHAVRRGNRY